MNRRTFVANMAIPAAASAQLRMRADGKPSTTEALAGPKPSAGWKGNVMPISPQFEDRTAFLNQDWDATEIDVKALHAVGIRWSRGGFSWKTSNLSRLEKEIALLPKYGIQVLLRLQNKDYDPDDLQARAQGKAWVSDKGNA